MICTAVAVMSLATSAWANEDAKHMHAHESAQPAVTQNSAKVDAHTQQDIDRHLGMARAHQQAAQCLSSGTAYDDCQKQLQTQCKGLALGKNCGMRHSH